MTDDLTKRAQVYLDNVRCRCGAASIIAAYMQRDAEQQAEIEKYKTAYLEWSEKTEWVQKAITANSLPVKYLGWHRADILKAEIERLRKSCSESRDWLRHFKECLEKLEELTHD